MCSGLLRRQGNLFISTHVSSSLFWTKKIEAATIPNRSVYAIAALYRENFLAKVYGLVVGGTARPGSRRGLPGGVTVFANATID